VLVEYLRWIFIWTTARPFTRSTWEISPTFTPASYRLEIGGHVKKPVTLEWPDVRALPAVAQTTTFHCVADEVEAAVGIPMLHLADVVAAACLEAGLTSVAFVGTAFAMSSDFFTQRIGSHGLTVLVPDERHHGTIDAIIYDELVHGKVLDRSRATVVSVIDELWDAGAQGVILGCTELELLVHQADSDLPVFPCTSLHVRAALDAALE